MVPVVEEGGDVLDAEALVERHGDMPNVFGLDIYNTVWLVIPRLGYPRFFLLFMMSFRK